MRKFHRYIYSRHFILCTDHESLLTIFGSKSGIAAYGTNRLQRWALILMMYDFKMEYVNTKDFGCVDVLSRLINSKWKPDEDIIIGSTKLEENCWEILTEQFSSLPKTFKIVLQETNKCKTLQSIISALNNRWTSKASNALAPYYAR